MERMAEIKQGIEFIPVQEKNLVVYSLRKLDGTEKWDEVIVIYNSNRTTKTLKINGIDSNWKVVVDDKTAGTTSLVNTSVKIENNSISVPPISAVIIHN